MIEFPALNIQYFFYHLYRLLRFFYHWLVTFVNSGALIILAIFWFVLFLICFSIVIYLIYRIFILRGEELKELDQAVANTVENSGQLNIKWEKIITYLNSDNASDWKSAILEADILLDELVTKMGYEGENLGERLKKIEPSDFLTLNDAWEAHKVRNMIAHEGDYVLTKRETIRVIELFRHVFEEFHFI